MALPAWPASLPQRFEVEGYQEGRGDGRLRSQMDAGPGKVRQRFRAANPVSGVFAMTEAQLATCLDFYDDALSGGTLAFTFPAQRGSETWLVRFGEAPPSWTPSQALGEWRVAIALEILP